MNFIADIFFSHTVSCGKQLFTAAGIFQQQNQFFPGQIMVVFGFFNQMQHYFLRGGY